MTRIRLYYCSTFSRWRFLQKCSPVELDTHFIVTEPDMNMWRLKRKLARMHDKLDPFSLATVGIPASLPPMRIYMTQPNIANLLLEQRDFSPENFSESSPQRSSGLRAPPCRPAQGGAQINEER